MQGHVGITSWVQGAGFTGHGFRVSGFRGLGFGV